MRKFFGAKVVSGSNRAAAGSATARRQPTTQRSNLTKPKPNWWPAKLREGLTLRALTDEELQSKVTRSLWTDDNERWWTMEYSKRYKGVTRMFLQVVLSGDPEGLYAIIRQVPWHADALLQLAELYSHREEHSQAADFIERAMFTYERAFVGAFTFTSGTNRLDFDHVENRPFFLSLHRQVIDLQRRGVVRTAFEFARLLYSLDPWSDPHGALLHLDFLAIKAGMHQWLLDLVDVFECSTRIEDKDQPQAPALALPGVAYAVALAWRAKNAEAEATAALKHAVIEFPSIVTLLADKADISLPAEVRSHPAFRVYTRDSSAATEQSLLHLLSHLYVQRSHGLWKDPKQSSWFVETVGQVVRAGELPSTALGSKGHQYMRNLARTPAFPVSIYRHVMVLGSSAQRLLAYIPAQVASLNSLACDPLPPPTRVSMYDDEFFRGSEDAFTGAAGGQRGQAANARMLERLVPDPLMRRQLQEFFDGHPRLLQLFPGGVVQFAQVAGNLPEDVLQELMLAQVMQEEGGAAHGGMPGGMPGEDMVALEFLEEFDNGQADGDDNEVERDHEHRDLDPDAEAGTEDEDEDEEDEDEDEEVAPMPVRVLRNIFNRFWGGGAAQDADSEESEEDGEIALDDVD
ncbi:DUF654-domain-containing protein [Auriscalpium vulgare]|uniref:DUF654-domain-containing protein n=1 Tax=Auriscalpium vulgare TaxID=40419 RepID=A0ACB8S9U3_9AGAM|nr:DUF654-domain-containing protein [Auriscalpium vulgare]